MNLTMYGIPNCDQVKKARTWLTAQGLAFEFHDFKKAGVSTALLELFLSKTDWSVLLNRKGTTWRKLSPQEQAAVIDAGTAMPWLITNPSIIKRPILLVQHATSSDLIVGFSEAQYQYLTV